jgi:glyoxylase I family protein
VIAIESIQHVSVSVTDLTRARRFYTEVLGLSEIPRPDFDFAGAWFGIGDQQIHLIVHPGARTLRGTTEIGTRDGHVALRVRSYHETLEHLRAHAIPCLERPHNKTPWAQIYVTDPDGNVVELNADRVD